MKVLELFAGSRSIGKVAESRGHEVFSIDINPFEGIDLVKDINELEIEDVPFIPDVVWSGTPCTTYSLAAGSTHRFEHYKPKTEFAFKCDEMNVRVNRLISEWLKLNPKLLWHIENPRGMLRKMWFMQGLPRTTVWYCQYNDHYNRAKPTDIWSNNIGNPLFNPDGWFPRPECWNGRKNCHEEAPRGSRTGTQGLKGNYERSTYPEELCIDIIKACENKLK